MTQLEGINSGSSSIPDGISIQLPTGNTILGIFSQIYGSPIHNSAQGGRLHPVESNPQKEPMLWGIPAYIGDDFDGEFEE
jgi:hypothetical protein